LSASATQIFGERIRELRQKRGLTQVELSERSGYPQGRISEIERGGRAPTLMTMIRLAVALDCDLTQLVAPFKKSDLRTFVEK
jgi:transcriptional regulator with XRE-family HTH domain